MANEEEVGPKVEPEIEPVEAKSVAIKPKGVVYRRKENGELVPE